ncbi:MAG: hypothetical protein R6V07_11170 [Armatimonadota bacterium]
MSRLVVRNSSLVYPPVPDDILRDDDVVLPLVDRFEDAMFLPSPFYAEYYEPMADRYWQVEALARDIGGLLPDLLTCADGGPSASAWEGFLGSFIKFTLGPLTASAEAVEAACGRVQPDEVIGWDEPGEVSWWGGRQLVEDVAQRASELTGARLKLRSNSLARAVRTLTHPSLVRAQAAWYFLRQMRPSESKLPKRYDVLIASLGQTIRGLAEGIGGSLSESGLRVLMVEIPADPLRPGLTEISLPHVNLYTLRDGDILRRSLDAVEASFEWHRQFVERLNQHPEFPLRGSLRSALIRRMHNVLARAMPVQLYHQQLWQRLFDAVQPRTLLAFNHYGTALAPGVLQANDHGMATVLCQHGMGGPHWRSTTVLPFDLALTFGEFARDVLGSVAYRETQFAITGHAGWDRVRAAPELQVPGPQTRIIVLATMQTIEQHLRAAEPRWWLRELALACQTLGAELVVKPHPNESDTSDYEALARELPDAVRFVAHGERSLEKLIDECTVLATRYSTTAVQAIMAGKLVMTVFPTGAREHYPFAEEGAAVKVDSCDELLPTLRALLTDRELQARLAARRDGFISHHAGPLDGGATDRIVEHLLRVTSEAVPDHGRNEEP